MASSCPICKSEVEPQVLGEASLGGSTRFDLVECRDCATRYLSPMPSADQLQQFYAPQYYGSDWYKQRGWGTAFARHVLAKKKPGRFLDLGCGLGYFIESIKKHSDWEVHGVEIAAAAVDYAREQLGLDVRQGELVDVKYPDAYFDYIQINNVLEHVPDPMSLLRECRRILKSDGVIDLRVPNGKVDSLDLVSYYKQKNEPGFSKSGHLYFFPKKTLLWMFDQAGLQLERSKTFGIRRGLASLGFWPRFKDWKRHYAPRPQIEADGKAEIVLPPDKRRPDFYYTYRMTRMNLRMFPGMREFGLDFALLLKHKSGG